MNLHFTILLCRLGIGMEIKRKQLLKMNIVYLFKIQKN